jgi:hypothetical protein
MFFFLMSLVPACMSRMFTLFLKKEEAATAVPQQETTMLMETKLSHVPSGCHAVHGNAKPSAKCWKAFLQGAQNSF